MMKRFGLALSLYLALAFSAQAAIFSAGPNPPTYPTGFDAIDATQSAGADMCAKIVAAAGTLNTSSGGHGGIIDARGFSGSQPCAASISSGWPASFPAEVLFGTVELQTAVTQVIPNQVHYRGLYFLQVNLGTRIRPGTGFPFASSANVSLNGTTMTVNAAGTSCFTVGMNISGTGVTMQKITALGTYTCGPGTGTLTIAPAAPVENNITVTGTVPVVQQGTCGSQCFSVQLEYAIVSCISSATNNPVVGAIGVENNGSQENSYLKHVNITGCTTGLWVHSGAQNSGPYMGIQCDGGPTASGGSPLNTVKQVCFMIGNDTGGNAPLGVKFLELGATGGGNSATPDTLVLIDGAENIELSKMHCEFATDCILAGRNDNAGGNNLSVHVDQISCATGLTGNCVELSSNKESVDFLATIITQQTSSNVLKDNNTDGCTLAAVNQSWVGSYLRGFGSPTLQKAGGTKTHVIISSDANGGSCYSALP